MDAKTLLKNAYAMPICTPAYPRYPRGKVRFYNREFMIITYRSDPEAVRRWVPEPLKVTDPIVKFEVIHMPDSEGVGSYYESGQVIQVEHDGKVGGLTHMMYLDSMAGVLVGREQWGFPKKLGFPEIKIEQDTLVGTLEVSKIVVATATMGYKYEEKDLEEAKRGMESASNFLLKVIPHVDDSLRICELVKYPITDVVMKGAWSSPGALTYVPHALAPFADLPVLEVLSADHMLMDLSIGFGEVVHDYLA
jgi:acetoacetate decarboxylase